MAFGPKTLILLALVVLGLAVYVNYPAPTKISKHLAKWEKTAAKTKVINGYRIFYKDESGRKSSGPVLLCLHGFPTSNYDWLKVWPALLEKFSRVIAPDFLGYGLSDKPVDHRYSIMEQADIVETLLDFLKVPETHILAHDYGDTVAQELLARFEDRKTANQKGLIISSVCLLNGGIFPETNFPRFLQRILLVPYVEPILTRLTNIYLFSKGLGDVFGPETQPTLEEFEDFWGLMRQKDGHLVVGKLLQYIPERSANRHRWTGVLKLTSVPVHTIYGPADPVNPPGFVDFWKKTVPNHGVSVLKGHIGHYPQWEDPSGCMLAYFDFLKTLPFYGPPKEDPDMDEIANLRASKPVKDSHVHQPEADVRKTKPGQEKVAKKGALPPIKPKKADENKDSTPQKDDKNVPDKDSETGTKDRKVKAPSGEDKQEKTKEKIDNKTKVKPKKPTQKEFKVDSKPRKPKRKFEEADYIDIDLHKKED